MAPYKRNLWGFETCSCKPVPRGRPSSLLQLRTLGVSSRIEIGQIRVLSITDLQFTFFTDIIKQKQNI